MAETRTCTQCGNVYDLTQFYTRNDSDKARTHHSECRACSTIMRKRSRRTYDPQHLVGVAGLTADQRNIIEADMLSNMRPAELAAKHGVTKTAIATWRRNMVTYGRLTRRAY